jgi:hypothetical protein
MRRTTYYKDNRFIRKELRGYGVQVTIKIDRDSHSSYIQQVKQVNA